MVFVLLGPAAAHLLLHCLLLQETFCCLLQSSTELSADDGMRRCGRTGVASSVAAVSERLVSQSWLSVPRQLTAHWSVMLRHFCCWITTLKHTTFWTGYCWDFCFCCSILMVSTVPGKTAFEMTSYSWSGMWKPVHSCCWTAEVMVLCDRVSASQWRMLTACIWRRCSLTWHSDNVRQHIFQFSLTT